MNKLVTQVSLAGGEISPYLLGRSDLTKYKTGASKLRNMLVNVQGGIRNRPGTKFCNYSHTRDGEYVEAKFVPFDNADNDTVLLVFSDGIIYFYKNGAAVKVPDPFSPTTHPDYLYYITSSDGEVMSLTAPWGSSDVHKLKVVQSNDIMTITCGGGGYDVYELSRHGTYDWRIKAVSTVPTVLAPTGVSASAHIDLTVPSGVSDPVIFNTKTYYKVSAIDSDGQESLPSTATVATNDLSWKKNYNEITWDAVSGAKKYNIYKAVNSVFGYIGSTDTDNGSPNDGLGDLGFRDKNFLPDYNYSPKDGRNPFSGSRKPAVVEFHQQRRWFASYPSAPQSFDASGSGIYNNFGVSIPAKEDDAIAGTIAARKRQEIYWMVPLQELVVFTQSGEWKFIGGNNDGDVITPQSIDLRPQSEYGCSKYVKPIVVGSRILFMNSLGKTLYDMGYEVSQNKYISDELSALSTHLFENRKVVNWSFNPIENVLWIVMSDGALVSFTYHREHEVWAACQHDTSGKFLDVCCIMESDYVHTYFLVDRYNENESFRCIERMSKRESFSSQDCYFLDCGLSYDSPIVVSSVSNTTDTVTFTTSTPHGLVEGDEITVTGVYGYYGDYNTLNYPPNFGVEDLNVVSSLKLAEVPWDGYLYEASENSYDRGVNKKFTVVSKTTNSVTVDFSSTGLSSYVPSLSYPRIRKALDQVSGMSHLAGRTVNVLGDGMVFEGVVVASDGSISLPEKCGKIHAGLGYTSEFYSLDIELGSETSQGIVRKVGKVHLRVKNTRGVFIGSSPYDKDMVEPVPRTFEDFNSPPLLYSGYISSTPHAKFGVTGLVYVRQKYPLPLEISSISPDIEYGSPN